MILSPSETSVIIGMFRQGNPVDVIYYELELDKKQVSVTEVQKVIESINPPQRENERYNILKEFSNENILIAQ